MTYNLKELVPAEETHLDWRCDECLAVWFNGELEQSGEAMVCEHTMIRVSSCCGADVNLETGTCSECRGHA